MEHYGLRVNSVKCYHTVCTLFKVRELIILEELVTSSLLKGASYLRCVTYSRKYSTLEKWHPLSASELIFKPTLPSHPLTPFHSPSLHSPCLVKFNCAEKSTL